MMIEQTLFFEDFPAGATVDLEGSYEVTREEIIAFAEEFDPQLMHLNDEKIPGMDLQGPIASGWHTCAISMRLMSDSYISRSHGLGSPGMDALKWYKPVYPGDTLRLRRTCKEARVSKSRPEMGICTFYWELVDQNDELVMDLAGLQMFRTRTSLQEDG